MDLPELGKHFPVPWSAVNWTQQGFLNAHFRAPGTRYSPEARTRPLKKFSCVHFTPKLGHQELESLGLENVPQVPGDRAEVCQNHDARKAVSATLSVLK